jgi:hypothetical protein
MLYLLYFFGVSVEKSVGLRMEANLMETVVAEKKTKVALRCWDTMPRKALKITSSPFSRASFNDVVMDGWFLLHLVR